MAGGRNENPTIETKAEKQKKTAPAPELHSTPTGPVMGVLLDILGAGENLAELPARKAQVDHSVTYLFRKDPDNPAGRFIDYQSGKTAFTVWTDITKQISTNGAAQKLLVFFLSKVNEQALHKGILTRNYIVFSLQELVTLRMYSNKRNARAGIERAATVLENIRLKGTIQYGPTKREIASIITGLFRTIAVHDNACIVILEDAINWNTIITAFTSLPDYYYSLSTRASELLFYVFFLARQHLKDIDNKEYFTISLKSVQQRLFLPDNEITGRTTNPKREIRGEIERVVDEINAESKAASKATKKAGSTDNSDKEDESEDFKLEIVCDSSSTGTITEYINTGYLKVTVSGEYAKPFKAQNNRNTDKKEKKQKHKQEIADAAHALNLAKKMEAESEADKEEGT